MWVYRSQFFWAVLVAISLCGMQSRAAVLTAVQVGDDLVIFGSNATDIVLVRPAVNNGGVQVTGLGDTFVNQAGNRSAFFDGIFGDVHIDLGRGGDRLRVSGFDRNGGSPGLFLRGDLRVNLGGGRDVAIFHAIDVSGDLMCRGDSGSDYIQSFALTDVSGSLLLDGGDGHDFVACTNTRIDTQLQINGGSGRDQIALHNSRFKMARGLVRGGAGNDRFRISFQRADNSELINVSGGTGFDTLELSNTLQQRVRLRDIENNNRDFSFDHPLEAAFFWLLNR